MTGFKLPNYTQVPNELFDMLPNMSDPELRFTLALLRQTSGFHVYKKTLSTKKACDLTGLSANSVTKGAREAQKRGTVKRLNNPDDKKSAEWELKWDKKSSSKFEDDNNKHPQNLRKTSSKSEEQVAVKESIKKEELKKGGTGAVADTPLSPVFSFYEQEFGKVTNYIKSKLTDAINIYSEDWALEALEEAVNHNATKWAYVNTILERWKREGKTKSKKLSYAKKLGNNSVNLTYVNLSDPTETITTNSATKAAAKRVVEKMRAVEKENVIDAFFEE
jgi:DnaD/phage-associated family protein